MSCPPEHVYSVYVDGELPAGERREVEAHLVGCQRCRARIVALEDEASVLLELLQQRAPATRTVPARARARGLALGLAPSVALGAVALTAGGWLLEQRLPGFSWMDPGNLIGAYEMAFDTIFTLRDALPVLFDLGVAVGATLATAAVLTFLVSALLRRVAGASGVAGALLLLLAGTAAVLPAPARALDVRWDERTVEVARGEVLEDTLIASAETFEIEGVVRGDVLALAERLTIRGRVEGNVFAAAQELLVTGSIDGSLHMLCERCTLEGEVTGNLYSGGEDVTVAPGAKIGRDAQLFGAGMRIDGHTGRDLSAAGEWVEIRGEVGRTARTHSERLTVSDEARIGGDLRIEIPENGEAEVSPSASIGGETTQSTMEHSHGKSKSRWVDGGFYLRSLMYVASAFLLGLLLRAIVPSLFWGTLETSSDYLRCLGTGFVTLVAVPILLVLCAISVVGIPIAILGGFAYLSLLFVSTIVVAALVGSSITGAEPESAHAFGLALLLGLVILVIAMNLPFIGGLLRLLVGLAGMGLVVIAAQDAWRSRGRGYA